MNQKQPQKMEMEKVEKELSELIEITLKMEDELYNLALKN